MSSADAREIASERVFDAPRARVFEAFGDPTQLAQWWGPKGFTNTFHEIDLRPGGTWRFTMRGPDGTEYQLHKEFLEVEPLQRVVLKHLQPMHGFTMTMTYRDVGERTRLTWLMRFDSAEPETVRQFIIEANEQNFDRLAAHLAARPRSEDPET